MQAYRPLSIVVLILALGYLLADLSGGVQAFDNIINERDGWKKHVNGGYVKHEIVIETTYHYSILHDPQAKEKFQMFSGAMKKSAVDRMRHIINNTIVREDQQSDEDFRDDMKFICHYMNGNTIIINGQSSHASTHTQTFNIGLGGFF